jgi:hypothetical protein
VVEALDELDEDYTTHDLACAEIKILRLGEIEAMYDLYGCGG